MNQVGQAVPAKNNRNYPDSERSIVCKVKF